MNQDETNDNDNDENINQIKSLDENTLKEFINEKVESIDSLFTQDHIKDYPISLLNKRKLFLKSCQKQIGTPQKQSAQTPEEPLYNSKLFLDCCKLVRESFNDLSDEFKCKLLPQNQSYQYDILPAPIEFDEMLPGDLIFWEGTQYQSKKQQKHHIVHVEVQLGGRKTLGARWAKGVVQEFIDQRFTSLKYSITNLYFKSIDRWLKGETSSLCAYHPWKKIPLKPKSINKDLTSIDDEQNEWEGDEDNIVNDDEDEDREEENNLNDIDSIDFPDDNSEASIPTPRIEKRDSNDREKVSSDDMFDPKEPYSEKEEDEFPEIQLNRQYKNTIESTNMNLSNIEKESKIDSDLSKMDSFVTKQKDNTNIKSNPLSPDQTQDNDQDIESQLSFDSNDLNANRLYCGDSRIEEAEEKRKAQKSKVLNLNFETKLNLKPIKSKDLKKDDWLYKKQNKIEPEAKKRMRETLEQKFKSDAKKGLEDGPKPPKQNLWNKIKSKLKSQTMYPSKVENKDSKATPKVDDAKDKEKKKLTHKQVLENMEKREQERKQKADVKKKLQEQMEMTKLKPKKVGSAKPHSKRKAATIGSFAQALEETAKSNENNLAASIDLNVENENVSDDDNKSIREDEDQKSVRKVALKHQKPRPKSNNQSVESDQGNGSPIQLEYRLNQPHKVRTQLTKLQQDILDARSKSQEHLSAEYIQEKHINYMKKRLMRIMSQSSENWMFRRRKRGRFSDNLSQTYEEGFDKSQSMGFNDSKPKSDKKMTKTDIEKFYSTQERFLEQKEEKINIMRKVFQNKLFEKRDKKYEEQIDYLETNGLDHDDIIKRFIKRNQKKAPSQAHEENREKQISPKFSVTMGVKAEKAVEQIKDKLQPYTKFQEILDYKREHEEDQHIFKPVEEKKEDFNLLKTRSLECPLTIPIPADQDLTMRSTAAIESKQPEDHFIKYTPQFRTLYWMEKNFRAQEKVPNHLRAMSKVLAGDDPLFKDRRARGWGHIFGTKARIMTEQEMQVMEDERQRQLAEIKKQKMEETRRLEKEKAERLKREREEKERLRKEKEDIVAPKLKKTGLDLTKMNKNMLLESIINNDMVAKNEDGEPEMDFTKYYAKLKDELNMLMKKIPEGDTKVDINKRNKIFEIFDTDASGVKDNQVHRSELTSKIREWGGAENLMDFELGLNFIWEFMLGTEEYMSKDVFHDFLKQLKMLINIWMVFHKVDLSQDSKINIEEFMNAMNNGELDDLGLKDLHQFGTDLFNFIDYDGSKLIDFQEFSAFVFKHRPIKVEDTCSYVTNVNEQFDLDESYIRNIQMVFRDKLSSNPQLILEIIAFEQMKQFGDILTMDKKKVLSFFHKEHSYNHFILNLNTIYKYIMLNGCINESLGFNDQYQKNDIEFLLKSDEMKIQDKNLNATNVQLYATMLQGDSDSILRSRFIESLSVGKLKRKVSKLQIQKISRVNYQLVKVIGKPSSERNCTINGILQT